ncbi:AAA family ATPase [Peptacetobacter sp. AB800]|uniref:AAA family ATPase n=1 Tax=Peptacetobacter sp. AB800 TaxID=3388428 RepID=UPI0039FCB0C8
MAFTRPKINRASNNINKLRIYIRAVRKWGKTTLFRDYVECLYNGDASKGLLVGVGYEHGYDMLDNLNALHVDTWKDLIELKNWLISEKGNEHNIEIVAFDVVDELIPIAEKEACRLSQIKMKKKCESINSAFGGLVA